MSEFQEQLDKVEKFHGHLCGGIVMGTKMTMLAMKELGFNLNEPTKDLVVFVEIGRCMADAVQVVSGCTLGKGSLNLLDYGRFAGTFLKISTGEAVRITDMDIQTQVPGESKEELIERLTNTSNDVLFRIEKVRVRLREGDLPGHSSDNKIVCPICGEIVKDNQHIIQNGVAYCKACVVESYYEKLD
ncbi:FmdE family protein [Methanobrevibacter curvatus]|nr:FmdE family protein [Methanobrevibacter curvatus]